MGSDPKIEKISRITYLKRDKSRSYSVTGRIILTGLFWLLPLISTYSQWLTGYLYRKTITIPAAQISGGPHVNFPVLISITDPDLATVINGGFAENANGWDIVFSLDHLTTLNHQVEYYNATNGNLIAWVNIPTLPVTGITFYIYFGNSSVSGDPSTTSTWSTDFNGVWHLAGLADATSNGNNATDNGTSNTTTAKIYNARNIPGTAGEYFQITQTTIPNGSFTISLWFRPDVVSDGTLFDLSNSGSGIYFFSAFNSTSLLWYFESANDNDAQTSYNTTLSAGAWYYLTVIGRYNSNYHELYLNGSFVGSSSTSLNNKPVLNNIRVGADWGYNPVFTHGDFNGRIDEFRIANTPRSADWILTEFRNQDTPGLFMSFSSRESALPQKFNITGSGSYCAGSGLTVQLSGSEAGVNYQLRKSGTNEGSPVAGTGGVLSWNGMTEGVYTMIATKVASGLSSTMNGSATVIENPSPAAALGYLYQKQITLNPASGGSDLYNFPVLINISSSPTRDELRTVLNGGHVENVNGWDIIFTDSEYNKLNHQVESYTATNGNLLAWVRVPVLSASGNTVIRVLYGNPQVSADPSTYRTWSNEYLGVWHLSDLLDATLNGNNGTDAGSTSAAGLIGLVRQFNGTSRIDVPRSIDLEPTNNLTVSMWIRRTGGQNQWAKPLWYGRNDVDPWGPYGFEFNGDSDNSIYFHVTNGSTSGNVLTGTIINDGIWYLLTGTFDGSTVRFYLNNNLIGSTSLNGPIGQYNIIGLTLGNRSTGGQGFTGYIDEVRISSATKPIGWIQTEYNNQNSPSTFYSISSEAGCSVYSFTDLCSDAPISYSVPNTGGHTYNWSVVGGVPSTTTGNSITVTWGAAGPYTIQLQEIGGGCTGNSPVYNVTVSAQPIAQTITKNPNTSDVCINGMVSATFSGGSGGINPIDLYESSINAGATWQSYTSGSPISSAVAGVNRLQIRTRRTSTGQGCTSSPYNTVTWNNLVQPTWSVITPPASNICVGGSVTFSATLNNPGGGTVQWVRSATSMGVGTVVTSPNTPPATGTYYYRPQYLPGYGGCNLADGTETAVTVQVDPTWNVITAPVSNICVGGSVTFSATLNNPGTGTVQWVRSATSMGVGTVVTSPNTPPSTGTYYYRPQYLPGYGGCNLADGTETAVTVQVDPTWNVITAPVSNICVGGSVTFSATLNNPGTGTVQWVRSATSMGVGIVVTSPNTPPATGTYYYRPQYLPGYGGCNLADGTETAVTVQVDPTWNVITAPVSNICVGGSVTFSATLNNPGTGTVQWVRSATSMGVGIVVTSPNTPPATGTYYYRPQYLPGYGGCNLADGTETAVTVQVDPTWNVITAPVSNICVGGSVTFSATLNNPGYRDSTMGEISDLHGCWYSSHESEHTSGNRNVLLPSAIFTWLWRV